MRRSFFIMCLCTLLMSVSCGVIEQDGDTKYEYANIGGSEDLGLTDESEYDYVQTTENNIDNQKRVKVPDLIGKHYDALPTYDGLSVHQIASEYHNQYEEGCIISQKPEKFTMVQPGTEIIVTVSKGVAPQSIQMQNLVNLTEEKAKSIINSQSLGLIIETQTEYSPTMAAGKVIRTFPEAYQTLTVGQKVILVISLGEIESDNCTQ